MLQIFHFLTCRNIFNFYLRHLSLFWFLKQILFCWHQSFWEKFIGNWMTKLIGIFVIIWLELYSDLCYGDCVFTSSWLWIWTPLFCQHQGLYFTHACLLFEQLHYQVLTSGVDMIKWAISICGTAGTAPPLKKSWRDSSGRWLFRRSLKTLKKGLWGRSGKMPGMLPWMKGGSLRDLSM